MAETRPPPIELRQLRYLVNGTAVLDGIDLSVGAGEILGVMGRSGTGKTTLLRLIMGLIPPTSGQVLVDGVDITKLNEGELDRLRLRMGMIFQGAALFDSMTVGQNVAFALVEHRRLRRDQVAARVSELLHMVDMVGREEMMPAQLSGGMRKRVGLARALALEPAIVLYDEPTAGLDPISAAAIDDLIVRLRDRLGVTSVIVSHDVNSLRRACGRIALLHQGHFLAVGSMAELEQSSGEAVTQFLSGSAEGPLTESAAG
jgi:phospholipid/cholesterol/gamma-HCH transport system ATP-binding protein